MNLEVRKLAVIIKVKMPTKWLNESGLKLPKMLRDMSLVCARVWIGTWKK